MPENRTPNADEVEVVDGQPVYDPPAQPIDIQVVKDEKQIAEQAIVDAQAIIDRNRPIVENADAILDKVNPPE